MGEKTSLIAFVNSRILSRWGLHVQPDDAKSLLFVGISVF